MRFCFRPIRRFIHVDDENARKPKSIPTRPQKQSSYVSEDLQKIFLDYPELSNFMSNVARDRNTLRASRLYKGKEVQNDFRWEISFMYVGDYKYCERIQRHHKQNNI